MAKKETTTTPRVLVLGAAGQIGRELHEILPAETSQFRTREALDVRHERLLDQLIATLKPEVVINAAAVTDYQTAATDRKRAWAVNAHAATRVAKLCAAHGAAIIQLSCSEVYGDDSLEAPYQEMDPATPVNILGQTKAAAEHAVLNLGHLVLPAAIAAGYRWYIIRLSSVFGRYNPANHNFVQDFYIRGTRSRIKQYIPTDVLRTPVYAPWAAQQLMWLVCNHDTVPCGTYHLASREVASLADMAREVKVCAKGQCQEFETCGRDQYAASLQMEPYLLARNGALNGRRWLDMGGPGVPPWQEGVARFVHEASRT